jgi:hypothetical protein
MVEIMKIYAPYVGETPKVLIKLIKIMNNFVQKNPGMDEEMGMSV